MNTLPIAKDEMQMSVFSLDLKDGAGKRHGFLHFPCL